MAGKMPNIARSKWVGKEVLSGRGSEARNVRRFLLTMLIMAAIVVGDVIVSAVMPAQADLSLASHPSVNTLPATGVSGTAATLNGEITAFFSAVSAGGGHSLALGAEGTLWSWGYNASGQLGLDDTTDRHVATQVGSATDWASVSAGYYHSLGVRSDGTLWAWGINADGQLGLGDTTDRHVPTQVGSAADWVSVSAGYYHSLGVRSDGTLWAWGRNEAVPPYAGDAQLSYPGGQLGLGDTTDRQVPTQVGSATDWVSVSGGISHSMGVRSDGTLWAWGWNPHGELGLGNIAQVGMKSPTRVGSAIWVTADGGNYHSVGVRSDGTLWFWGMTYGVSGGSIWTPTQVGNATNWVAVSDGNSGCLGLRSDGSLWSWSYHSPVIPSQVTIATDWVSVSDGGYSGVPDPMRHSLGVRSDGTLWSWGSNRHGQLGVGDTTDTSSPTQPILDLPSRQVAFEWGPTTGYGNETAAQTMTGRGTFSANISGLALGAVYHFRAKAVAHGETEYGVDKTLVTGLSPVVQGVGTLRGKRGHHLTITISGANFDGATAVSFGSGITVGNLDVSENVITADIAIDRDAELGARDISVTTPIGTGTMAGGFAVTVGSSRLQWWVYPVAIMGGVVALMVLVAVAARLARRLVG